MPSRVAILTTAEVAEALEIDTRTVHRWVAAGRLRPMRRAGGSLVFTADELARVAALPRPRRGRKPSRRPLAS